MRLGRILLLALTALVALPAVAAATTAQPTLSYSTITHQASVVAPSDGTSTVSLTIDAANFCLFTCGSSHYNIASAQGWDGSAPSPCAFDGSDATIIHCN